LFPNDYIAELLQRGVDALPLPTFILAALLEEEIGDGRLLQAWIVGHLSNDGFQRHQLGFEICKLNINIFLANFSQVLPER
jgi:hypothetical protein